MFKRFMLGLTFIAAFSMVGVVTPETSEARRYWGRRAVAARYYARPRYYRSYRPSYYAAPSYYGYPGYYSGYRGYYGPRRGVSFSFGY